MRPSSASTQKRPSSGITSRRTPEGQSSSPGSRPTSARPVPEPESRKDLAAMRSTHHAADDGSAGGFSEAHLATLEDAIKDTVRSKRSASDDSERMIMKIFKQVDDGDGDVDVGEFCAVCAQVGLKVSQAEAQALFERYGFDTVLPLKLFIDKLVKQPNRQLGSQMAVRKSAFQVGERADFSGKITYPKCRKAVYTPSDWDPALAERSAELPDAGLVLQYIYGYQGKENTAQNIFYTAENKLVYYVAGVGVVYNRPPDNSQAFFLGHSDDVLSLALCPAPVEFDHEVYPARTLVATGQITSSEAGPYICIWDSRAHEYAPDCPPAMPELVRLRFDKDVRGFTALAFSPSGKHLVAVALDNYHTVSVFDWRNKKEVSSGRGQTGDPPQVFGVEWNPHENDDDIPSAFLTFGRKNIKMWTCEDPKSGWKARQLSFGKQPMQTVTSAQWLSPREGTRECLIAAGMADGSIYIFKGGAAAKAILAHGRGPQININGLPGYHGVRGLRLCKNNSMLISGGADGTVLQWDASDGRLEEGRFVADPVKIRSPFGPADKFAPCIR
ncbi:WD40-repeat-containing domain protein [Dunaliella salina]|uniref:WD40-repeat-containing domain protein n=1 Tax=Dunaliella salina TaxID=3046 RepID=A0ABQ7GAT3_DUNSA|nr:WD40-repeat-containing domain protein [Dunaliella salina]|eukprot:KAF5831718.1 WD40-repeat-containing domain protein [Dunaliella salina]